jgi:predicted MFS family arabinose efflux permease
MPTIQHFVSHVKQYGNKHKALYLLSLMILFWATYDGIITFISPLIMTASGLSGTQMGIIIGTSSISGAFFDFIACRIFKNMFFRRMFLIMFILCFFYPLILFQANTFLIYLIAMAMWGIYYDLKNFAEFDFVARHIEPKEHASSFGIIQVFTSLGYLIAPILAGLAIGEAIDWKPFLISWIFLGISIIFFIYLIILTKKYKNKTSDSEAIPKKVSFLKEINLWEKIGRTILPVLILTLVLNFIDAFFWTIGPLLAESFRDAPQFSGFFMTAYSLPVLLAGWFVGSITAKYGKKKTAFISLLLGSLLLSTLFLFENFLPIIGVIFLSSILMSLSWPAINGAYADYIDETKRAAKEISGLQDLFTNIGYIIGPIFAGILFDAIGGAASFSILGLFGVVIAIVLLIITPKHIKIKLGS